MNDKTINNTHIPIRLDLAVWTNNIVKSEL